MKIWKVIFIHLKTRKMLETELYADSEIEAKAHAGEELGIVGTMGMSEYFVEAFVLENQE